MSNPLNSSYGKVLPVLLKGLTLAAGILYLVIMNCRNMLPVDSGDGLQHFSIAQEAFAHPLYLLDHWGKPLFTLLASPFAQISFKWYIGFNIIVYALTCLTAFRLFSFLKAGTGYYLLFPALLVIVRDYTAGVLGGMTEPLFGLMIVLMIWSGFRKSWYWFAIIASFTLFSRSEGMFVILLALPVLVFNGQWKAIPFLATGFLVYAIIGWYALDLFWWYFELNPYSGPGYGKGVWHHYLDYRETHTGNLTLLLFPFGLFGLFLFVKKKIIPKSVYVILFGFGIYIGIIVIHSYLWTYGLRGSLGLTRIATLGLPGALMLTLVGCHYITRELHFLPNVLFFILLSLGIKKEYKFLGYPNEPSPLDEIVFQAADYTSEHYPHARVHYYNPLVGWKMGIRIKDPDARVKQYFFNADTITLNGMQNGDIVIRDPAYGMEQGLPFDFIEKAGIFTEVKKFVATKPYSVYNNEPIEVHIYRIDKE